MLAAETDDSVMPMNVFSTKCSQREPRESKSQGRPCRCGSWAGPNAGRRKKKEGGRTGAEDRGQRAGAEVRVWGGGQRAEEALSLSIVSQRRSVILVRK